MRFRARQFDFTFPRPTLVMGVVNVTPDSFSDGGQFFDADRAVAHAFELIAEGAEILDIGGESTRPNAVPVDETEELRRTIPVIKKLAGQVKVPLSIDTMKPAVAQAAVDAGAAIINDVAANREDAEMWRIAAKTGAGYVCMHMRGTPQTMQSNTAYDDVIAEIGSFFRNRLQQLNDCEVMAEQVIFDVGIGFGKGLEHNLQLLAGLSGFTKLERPLLVGVSRKSFIGKLLGAEIGERLPAALACASFAVEAGVQIIRTHDVAATVQAVRMTEAILARKKK